MSKKYSLEAFDSSLLGSSDSAPTTTKFGEAERLQAFEQGYQAGWDDAISSSERSHSEVLSEISGNFRDLSFTYHEVRAQLLKDLGLLVPKIFEAIAPDLERIGLAEAIRDQICKFVREGAVGVVTISVNPNSRDVLESLIPKSVGFPFRVKEEETLGVGQVFLSFNGEELQMDSASVISQIRKLTADFFEKSSAGAKNE